MSDNNTEELEVRIRQLLSEYRVPKYQEDKDWLETYVSKTVSLISSEKKLLLENLVKEYDKKNWGPYDATAILRKALTEIKGEL